VVVAIILALAALSIGALMKATDWMRRTTAEELMTKVYTRIDSQIDGVKKISTQWDTPPSILALAAGNQRRARVIQFKYLQKWSFPVSFVEVRANYLESLALYNPSGGFPFAKRMHDRFYSKDANFWTANVPAEKQSAACLLAAYELSGSADDLSGNELGSFTYNRQSDGQPVTINFVMDPWEMPVVMYRWPTGLTDRIRTTLANPNNAFVDQDDPEGLLYDDTWQRQDLSMLVVPGTTITYAPTYNVPGTINVAMEIEARFHPIRRPALTPQWTQIFAPLTLVSGGTDRQTGLISAPDPVLVYTPGPGNPNYERARIDPANPQGEFDNLYSFRLRISTRGQ
jgi:hypothetical protein